FEGESEKDFYGNVSAPLRVVNRKVIVPTEQEIMNNSRARSARLRIAEKV
ncbi:MAG TPA: 16S rRNA (cytosine(1402)-N(4))-methyltransferase, partial [Bacteroidales bacterium]|nr:16S rRNA (cytosine(1402)-N(4))-methyltransferase [Bacteroidales bacterium]HOC05512.1 16S rRNA (cytosine(1402)-N(4))-methyltransferase [Bacteroidales bacterium]